MKIYKKTLSKNIQNFKFPKDKTCFLDIETTGLSRKHSRVYLIGIIYFDIDIQSWKLLQLFINDLKEEGKLLKESYSILSQFKYIINYNGTSFDISYINDRLQFNNINSYIKKDRSIDLYRIIKSNSFLFSFENYKLETIEEYLNIYRKDQLSGKECINLYFNFLNNNDSNIKNLILQHNYEDLYYLMDLVQILNIIDKKKSLKLSDSNYFKIDNYSITKNNKILEINGTLESNYNNSKIFNKSYSLITHNSNFKINIEIHRGKISPKIIGHVVFMPGANFNNKKYNIPNFMGIILENNDVLFHNILILSQHILNQNLKYLE